MNRLLVISSFSERHYAAIQTGTGFLFHYCTGRGGGLDEREFQRFVTDPWPKDIVIDNDQILEKRLQIRSPHDPRDFTCGCIELRTAEKTHLFYILGKHGETELRKFFGVSGDEVRLPEPPPDHGKSLERNEKDEAKYVALFLLCGALDLAVLFGTMFLPYRPWLILGLIALVLPVVLALVHPEWYTLAHEAGEARFLYGKQMLPAMFLLFIPPWLLMLRMPEVAYLSTLRTALIAVLPVLALSVIVWLLSRERSSSPGLLALVLSCWVLLGSGVGLAINALDYYYAAPTLTEQRRITALEKRSSSNCRVTTAGGSELVLPVDGEYFDALSVGGTVTVDYFDGALGAPFADIREPWE